MTLMLLVSILRLTQLLDLILIISLEWPHCWDQIRNDDSIQNDTTRVNTSLLFEGSTRSFKYLKVLWKFIKREFGQNQKVPREIPFNKNFTTFETQVALRFVREGPRTWRFQMQTKLFLPIGTSFLLFTPFLNFGINIRILSCFSQYQFSLSLSIAVHNAGFNIPICSPATFGFSDLIRGLIKKFKMNLSPKQLAAIGMLVIMKSKRRKGERNKRVPTVAGKS